MVPSQWLLTSWVPPQNKLTDFIINEDEQTVREGAEPPKDPEGKEGKEVRCSDSQAGCKLLNSSQSFLNINGNNMVFKEITDFI